ncbi:MAG: amidohydrolase family protein [Planctomycetota bacterium]
MLKTEATKLLTILIAAIAFLLGNAMLSSNAFAISMPPIQDDPPEDEPDGEPEEEPEQPEEDAEPADGEEGEDTGSSDGDSPEDDTEDGDEAAEDEEEEQAPTDTFIAVVNADAIHTISGPVLRGSTLLIKNSRIHAIGRNVKIPEEAETIDASGMHVYPGLIPPFSNGLFGRSPIADSTDVYSLTRQIALAAGITSTTSDNEAGKMTFGTADDLLIRPDIFVELEYGPNAPSDTRRIREALDGIIKYRRDLAEYEQLKADEDLGEDEESELEAPDDSVTKGRNARFVALLDGNATALFEADDAGSLLAIADLSERYGIRCVIRGGLEGWTVAPQLARGDISMIVSPRARQDRNSDLVRDNGSTIENAKILRDHGIRLSFMPSGGFFGSSSGISLSGLGGRDLQHYFLTAAFAVRGGMSEADAVRAMTLDSAVILGIDDRVGSLEAGKDADLIITDGNILHYQTLVQKAIVNGRLEYDKADAGLLSHVRPDGDRDNTSAKPYEAWPRRLGEDW